MSQKSHQDLATARLSWLVMVTCLLSTTLAANLAWLAQQRTSVMLTLPGFDGGAKSVRPDIVDVRNQLIATDMQSYSLYAEPNRLDNVTETAAAIAGVLPRLKMQNLMDKLAGEGAFEWIARQLTPDEHERIARLGLPGIGFRKEPRRYYPLENLFSHLIGFVDVDHRGKAGLENHMDRKEMSHAQYLVQPDKENLASVRLSVDTRIQHVLHDELSAAISRYKAKAGAAIMMRMGTGEVLGMVSLPDFNPNLAADALKKNNINRASYGLFELGSSLKPITIAAALDSGAIALFDAVDASEKLKFGRFSISDFHAKNRVLTVPEVFVFSSNIGAAKIAERMGIDTQREYFSRLGLDQPVALEIMERARPKFPKKWSELFSATASFGHGFAITPLHLAVATSSLLNGGLMIPPTLLPRGEREARGLAKRVISEPTSIRMRYLFRLNVEQGSGRAAEVPGYRIGGKTGTAEKVVNGRYSKSHRLNSFVAAFPIERPQYIVLTMIDEPQPIEGRTLATAGYNVAPLTAAIIARVGPLLDLAPEHK